MNKKTKRRKKPNGDSDIIAVAKEAGMIFYCRHCKKTFEAQYGRDNRVRCRNCDNLGGAFCRAHKVKEFFHCEDDESANNLAKEIEKNELGERPGAVEMEVVGLSGLGV